VRNAHTNGYAYGITDSNANGDANTDANSDSRGYRHSYSYTYSRDADTNAHLHTGMAKRAAYDHCTAQPGYDNGRLVHVCHHWL